jgi:hypothetical protein
MRGRKFVGSITIQTEPKNDAEPRSDLIDKCIQDAMF